MVRFLVEHGACVLATTLSDHETAAEKCEQDEEGYDGCSQYLYSKFVSLIIQVSSLVNLILSGNIFHYYSLCLFTDLKGNR